MLVLLHRRARTRMSGTTGEPEVAGQLAGPIDSQGVFGVSSTILLYVIRGGGAYINAAV